MSRGIRLGWFAGMNPRQKFFFTIRSVRSNLSKPKGSTLVDEQVRDIVLATICTHVFG